MFDCLQQIHKEKCTEPAICQTSDTISIDAAKKQIGRKSNYTENLSHHNTNLIITGGTIGCHNDNPSAASDNRVGTMTTLSLECMLTLLDV